jgi:mannonate dehydratase
MTDQNRREWCQRSLAMLAGAGLACDASLATASRPEDEAARPADQPGMKLALTLPHDQPERWQLARQIGVRHAIVPVSRVLTHIHRSQYLDALTKLNADYSAAGIVIAGVESHPVSAVRIKLGLPGRDEEIENYVAAIEALGRVGIPMCCYNFMAGLGWYRTKVDVPERGGALTSEFDNRVARQQGLTRWGEISQEKLWDNLTYFLQLIIPIAERANVKMALHPDDPPLSPLRGIGRILTSAESFRRVLQIEPSPVNGIAFCQANFKAMGEDIEKVAAEFCQQGKVFFVHFRDIEGQGERFRETFHDNGPTNMPRMLRTYHESGFRGPIRPDHAPTMVGEENDQPGYAMKGKIFAVGYMKGITDALDIPVE